MSAWAESVDSQREARIIESAWRDGSLAERQAIEPLVLRFVHRFADAPRACAMRLRLAWLKIERSELTLAEDLIQKCAVTARGVDADMASVLRASILARRGQPAVALAHLRALGGGLVDAESREVWAETALRVAWLARAAEDAFAFMLAWRIAAVDEHQPRVEREILAHVERFDAASRLRALDSLTRALALRSAEESRHRARLWLLEVIRASLGRLAGATGDSKLARRLVADAPTRYLRSSEGESLRRLAQALDVPEISMHASIGLLLELDNDRSSRESAELVTGAMRALSSVAKDEPVRLTTRELHDFELDEVEQAVGALIADGAALIVAGLSPKTATLAARLADAKHIPVILIEHPSEPVVASPFHFLVESPSAEVDRVFREGTIDSRKVTRLASDDAFCRAEERLGWTPEFVTTRGDVLVEADMGCALKLATELRSHDGKVRVWLGPESARAYEAFDESTVITSTQMSGHPPSKPVANWLERFQRLPSWYEALGHDVTRLGIEAIRRRGFDSLRGEALVRAGREQIRAALSVVESDLITTSDRGFNRGTSLRPTLFARRMLGGNNVEKLGR